MKSTLTLKPQDIDGWENFFNEGFASEDGTLDCDLDAACIAKFFACQGRTWKSKLGITLDTVSIHSNAPDEIGIRFYHKNQKARNRRGAFFSEVVLPHENIKAQIAEKGFTGFCNELADQAISEILEQMKK